MASHAYLRPMSEQARQPSCPICGKPRQQRYQPFCSKRCADVDLNRWLSGIYAVPGAAEDDEAERAGPSESGN